MSGSSLTFGADMGLAAGNCFREKEEGGWGEEKKSGFKGKKRAVSRERRNRLSGKEESGFERKDMDMEDAEKIRIRNRIIDGAVFAVLLAAASAVTLTLFYRQTMGSPAKYHSDMKAYILEMQGLESGYDFPYPVFFKLGAFIHLFAPPELSVAIAAMLLNSLGMVVTKLAFHSFVLKELESGLRRNISWLAGVFVSIAAVSLFFVSMLYPPSGIYLPGILHKYLGVFSANPFHNATYMAARPFAILAFLWYVKLLPVYERGLGRTIRSNCPEGGNGGAELRDYVLFSFFLLLAAMTKPSFTLVMVSTAGLLMLYRLIRAKFRNFVPTLQLGLCFVPTFLDLLYQYQGVFVPKEGEEGGLGFCFGEIWTQYCENIPLAVCLAVGFPILVFVLNYQECRKNSLYRFSWQIYLVSFVEAFLLYEKGFRKYDFNFSWGYMYGIFFCHFGTLLLLMQITARRMRGKKIGGNAAVGEKAGGGNEIAGGGKAAAAEKAEKRNGSTAGNLEKKDGMLGKAAALWRHRAEGRIGSILFALQWLAYLWHLVCGIFYFRQFMSGAMYY